MDLHGIRREGKVQEGGEGSGGLADFYELLLPSSSWVEGLSIGVVVCESAMLRLEHFYNMTASKLPMFLQVTLINSLGYPAGFYKIPPPFPWSVTLLSLPNLLLLAFMST